MFAVISADVTKPAPTQYHIGTNNGNAAGFVVFVERLISSGWLGHGEVLVMENAAIHVGGDASIVEDLLWETEKDGRPLRTVVLWLPTRSPELNPIELVFGIFARRLRSGQYNPQIPIADRASAVMDNFTSEEIVSCIRHCGYNL